MLDALHLEPGRKLRRRIIVILDRIAGACHARALEPRDRVQELELHGDGEGSGQPVHVELGRVEALGLEEDLVALRRWELHDLVFDGRAIARPATTDGTAVQRRFLQVSLDDFLHFLAGPCDPAWDLTRPLDALVEGETEVVAVAVLALDLTPVHGPTIHARWRPGLES